MVTVVLSESARHDCRKRPSLRPVASRLHACLQVPGTPTRIVARVVCASLSTELTGPTHAVLARPQTTPRHNKIRRELRTESATSAKQLAHPTHFLLSLVIIYVVGRKIAPVTQW